MNKINFDPKKVTHNPRLLHIRNMARNKATKILDKEFLKSEKYENYMQWDQEHKIWSMRESYQY